MRRDRVSICVVLGIVFLLLAPSVQGAAPVVATSAATSVGTTSALLHGNVTNKQGQNNFTVGFRWGKSSSLVGATNVTEGTGKSSGTSYLAFTHNLTGLASRTRYYFRAWALNGTIGFGQGGILSFVTGDPVAIAVTGATASFLAVIPLAIFAVVMAGVLVLVFGVMRKQFGKIHGGGGP